MFAVFNAGGRIEVCGDMKFDAAAVELPSDLDAKSAVLLDGEIVDAKSLLTFFIDDLGNKHPMRASPNWQALDCLWDDDLIKIGSGEWATAKSAAGKKADLLQYLASVRYRYETGGVNVKIGEDWVRLSTARGDDRAALQSTYSAIKDDLRPDNSFFKFADGVSRAVSNEDMRDAIVTAFGFVQSAFDIEAQGAAGVIAGQITSKAGIDALFA